MRKTVTKIKYWLPSNAGKQSKLVSRIPIQAINVVVLWKNLTWLAFVIITKPEERFISMSKLVQLARDCGKAVPIGSKCGSKCLILFPLFLK